MNNKKPKKYSVEWCEEYPQDDSRFYGVIIKNLNTENQSISVNMKRFCDYFHIDDERKSIRSNKNSSLFKPAKSKADEYKTNIIKAELIRIKKEWMDSQKIFIDKFLSEIKGYNFTAANDDNFQMGIADYDEASTIARIKSAFSHQNAEKKRTNLYYSLYAQYFHQLAAQIDAVTLKLLTENGYENDYFDRGAFLAFKGPKKESSIEDLDSYKHHQKMYAIWNFLKHNSRSTYDKVKEHCPEVLIDHEYKQGELACFYIQFSNDLIEQTIDDVKEFLVKYCEIVFDEDATEAEWNYEDFFHSYVCDEIEEYINPEGFRFF